MMKQPFFQLAKGALLPTDIAMGRSTSGKRFTPTKTLPASKKANMVHVSQTSGFS